MLRSLFFDSCVTFAFLVSCFRSFRKRSKDDTCSRYIITLPNHIGLRTSDIHDDDEEELFDKRPFVCDW